MTKVLDFKQPLTTLTFTEKKEKEPNLIKPNQQIKQPKTFLIIYQGTGAHLILLQKERPENHYLFLQNSMNCLLGMSSHIWVDKALFLNETCGWSLAIKNTTKNDKNNNDTKFTIMWDCFCHLATGFVVGRLGVSSIFYLI